MPTDDETLREFVRLDRKTSNAEYHTITADPLLAGLFKALNIVPDTDAGNVLSVTKADGTTVVFGVSTNGTPRLEMVNGANIVGFSDAYTTQKFTLIGATGAITCVTLTVSGAINALSASITNALVAASTNITGEAKSGTATLLSGAASVAAGISLGASTATTVGAAGGASALPAAPTGYLEFYIVGTKFKLPYYAA
jgi:hypothetical protein